MATHRPKPAGSTPSRSLLTPALAGALCATMALPPAALAAAPPPPAKHHTTPESGNDAPMPRSQRALHALDRLTFGPRPGDEATLNRIGFDAWFQRQLHPGSIPDNELAARLAQYPAMQLSQAELVARFPTPAMLRAYGNGNGAPPADPATRAVFADAAFNRAERKQDRLERKTADTATAPAPGMPTAATSAVPTMNSGPSPSTEPAVLPDPPLANTLLALPPEPRVQRFLALTPEQAASVRMALRGPREQQFLTGLSPAQAEVVMATQSPERLIQTEVLNTRLLRDVYSERQLQAVMTDFWLNHFSVYLHKNQNEPYLLPAFERETILPHALGSFEDLLVATARSPAMLLYLDNAESVGPDSRAAQRAEAAGQGTAGTAAAKKKKPVGINENYARELMELHTVGVKGGYTQQDVIEVARCFTGWTIERPADGGTFVFNANRHQPGDKVVLGHTIPSGGVDEGLAVLHILATSPATAHFLSEKLAERFVADTPPPALVDRMAAAYLKSGGDIATVLTTMVHSPEFWSEGVRRDKVKTPLEFVASALRATDADITNPAPMVQALNRLGMPLYGMQTPNGYSWQAGDWVSSNALLTRMNFALVLSGDRLGGTRLDWPALLGGNVDPAAVPDANTEARLEMLVLGQPAAAQTRAAALAGAQGGNLQQQAEDSFRAAPLQTPLQNGNPGLLRVKKREKAAPVAGPETPLATVGGLLLGSPDFQRR